MCLSGSVAVIGADTSLGRNLCVTLLERGQRVVAIDRWRPASLDPRLSFHRVDLTDPVIDQQLQQILRKEEVEVVVHAAFRSAPTAEVDGDHELEVLGSLAVMRACAEAGTSRLVVASSTMNYGPRPDNPNFLTEEHPLRGHPDAHCVRNRVEVEQAVAAFRDRHESVSVTVLRHCWVMGPTFRDGITGFFSGPALPRVLGYDPLLQFVHERDLLDVYEQAVLSSHPGVFNVVGRGVEPLSQLLALAGKRSLPLPAAVLDWSLAAAWRSRTGDPPCAFFDYLRYLWVADGVRGWAEFGPPVYSTREAWTAFHTAERMSRYA